MMLPFLMTIYTILGFVAHLCRDMVTGHMRRGWQDISHYSIGFIAILPLSLFMFNYLRDDVKEPHVRYVVSYTLAGISFGAGVVLGHWYKPVKE
jgi:hypothetical protein